MKAIITLCLCLCSFGAGVAFQKPLIVPKPVIVEKQIKVYQPFKHTKMFDAQAEYLSAAIPERALRGGK